MSHNNYKEVMVREPAAEKPCGFTLIEMLVTIAIISILSSILFPVFARARENARRASCLSNMKQLALAVLMYTQDNDGKLVEYTFNISATNPAPNGCTTSGCYGQMDPIRPYVKNTQIFYCPDAPRFTNTTPNAYATHYGFPAVIGTSVICAIPYNIATPVTTALDSVPYPSHTCLLGETYFPSGTSYTASGWGFPVFYAITGTALPYPLEDRHMEGANYAYMDGHVKWIKKEAVEDVYTKQTTSGATEAIGQTLPIVFAWHK